MKSSRVQTFIFLIAIVGAIVLIRTQIGGVAPTPTALASTEAASGLADAIERSGASGKPVFALATADWCPPCQALKRGALTDSRVESLLTERTEPVYLDVTDQNSPGAADAGSLGVKTIPAMYLLKDGKVVARHRGNLSADEMIKWLEGAI